MDAIINLRQVRNELKKVHNCATETDRFMAKCFPLMLRMQQEQLELLRILVSKRLGKRKRSDWQEFLSINMKQGKSIKQCAKLWKVKKEMIKA